MGRGLLYAVIARSAQRDEAISVVSYLKLLRSTSLRSQ